jgi:hypothetical protein
VSSLGAARGTTDAPADASILDAAVSDAAVADAPVADASLPDAAPDAAPDASRILECFLQGTADCDGQPENGCETFVNTADNCGDCGRTCLGGGCHPNYVCGSESLMDESYPNQIRVAGGRVFMDNFNFETGAGFVLKSTKIDGTDPRIHYRPADGETLPCGSGYTGFDTDGTTIFLASGCGIYSIPVADTTPTPTEIMAGVGLFELRADATHFYGFATSGTRRILRVARDGSGLATIAGTTAATTPLSFDLTSSRILVSRTGGTLVAINKSDLATTATVSTTESDWAVDEQDRTLHLVAGSYLLHFIRRIDLDTGAELPSLSLPTDREFAAPIEVRDGRVYVAEHPRISDGIFSWDTTQYLLTRREPNGYVVRLGITHYMRDLVLDGDSFYFFEWDDPDEFVFTGGVYRQYR